MYYCNYFLCITNCVSKLKAAYQSINQFICHTQTQLAVITKYQIHLDYVWWVVPKELMLRINGLPMYSEIKHIGLYCNTEIRPTRKENKSKQVYNSIKLKTQFKNQIHMNIPKYLTMNNHIFWAGCVINVVWTD